MSRSITSGLNVCGRCPSCDLIGPWTFSVNGLEAKVCTLTMIDPVTNLVKIAHMKTTQRPRIPKRLSIHGLLAINFRNMILPIKDWNLSGTSGSLGWTIGVWNISSYLHIHPLQTPLLSLHTGHWDKFYGRFLIAKITLRWTKWTRSSNLHLCVLFMLCNVPPPRHWMKLLQVLWFLSRHVVEHSYCDEYYLDHGESTTADGPTFGAREQATFSL